MGKGAGECAEREPMMVADAASGQRNDGIQYYRLHESLFEDNLLLVQTRRNRTILRAQMQRGGVESSLIHRAQQAGATVVKQPGLSGGFVNKGTSSRKHLYWKDGESTLSYTPHLHAGTKRATIQVWVITPGELPPVEQAYDIADLRVSRGRVWQLSRLRDEGSDATQHRYERLLQRDTPSIEAVCKEGLRDRMAQTPLGLQRYDYWHSRQHLQHAITEIDGRPFWVEKHGTWEEDLTAALQPRNSRRRALRSIVQSCDWEVAQQEMSVVRPIKHGAEFSARGWMEVRADDFETGLQTMRDLHLTDGNIVDNESIQLNPRHEAYAGTDAPELPDGCHLWHTVVGTDLNVLEKKLGGIADHGLLAGTERDLRKLQVTTLDIAGDKIQGIDWAIACSVGARPSYEFYGGVHLQLKREVLAKRNIFFAPRTLWSFKDYLKYNKQIGHQKFWAPTPPESLQEHLGRFTKENTAPGNKFAYNELWVGRKIEQEMIEEIVVNNKQWVKTLQKRFPDIPVKYQAASSKKQPVSF